MWDAVSFVAHQYEISPPRQYLKILNWKGDKNVIRKLLPTYLGTENTELNGQMLYMYTFIVTNMDLSLESLIKFYCNRGRMENFIKESKNGFDFDSMSSQSKIINSNRLQISMLAYNLVNWFKRFVLPAKMRKLQIDTIRLKLIKIASRVVRSARYTIFKLCSSCPYKTEFYETLENIRNLNLQPKLE